MPENDVTEGTVADASADAGLSSGKSEMPCEGAPEPVVRSAATLDGKLYKRLYGKWIIVMCILCALSAALLALWIAAYTIDDGGTFSELFSADYNLWGAAIILVCSVVFLLSVGKIRREANANVRENIYLFYEGEFSIETTQRGRQIGLTRLAYADCKKIRERKGFFLLTVPAVGLVVVDKEKMPQEDCARLRGLFGIPPPKKEKSLPGAKARRAAFCRAARSYILYIIIIYLQNYILRRRVRRKRKKQANACCP